MSSIWQYQALPLHLYLLQDEASPLIKNGHSKRMDIQVQTPAKTLTIQFYLHLSTNKQWPADFKILYISSTFITNTFHEAYFIEIDHIINFAILWNVWLSKTLCKIFSSNVFFTFDMSFFLSKHNTFLASSFIAILWRTSLFLVFKNKNYCYLCHLYLAPLAC